MMRSRGAPFAAALAAVTLAVALTACTAPGREPAASPSPDIASVPSVTPAPTAPAAPRVLLLSSSEDVSAAHLAAQAALEGMAREQGWDLTRLAAGTDMLDQALADAPMLVVSMATGLGASITQAAAAHPEVHLVAIDEADVQPSTNLLVIGPRVREDQVAFLAGALVGIANTNNRVGWIGEPDSVRGTLVHNAFMHGVRFTCPLCWVFEEGVAEGAGAEAGTAVAELLLPRYVDTAGAFPSVAGDGALLALASHPVRVAGSRAGFGEKVMGSQPEAARNLLGEVRVHPELLLSEVLPRFLAGEAFGEPLAYSIENGGLGYAPFSAPWITPGLQANLAEMMARLAAGDLQIGVNPETGEEQ
jgi:basic membrane lipoprotein Med (substrate-binding protein (PBP1-ABC) superfamily)